MNTQLSVLARAFLRHFICFICLAYIPIFLFAQWDKQGTNATGGLLFIPLLIVTIPLALTMSYRVSSRYLLQQNIPHAKQIALVGTLLGLVYFPVGSLIGYLWYGNYKSQR